MNTQKYFLFPFFPFRNVQHFEKKGKEHLVCKLQKSLYGLKQAAKAWYDKLNEVLVKIGFTAGKADTCLYMKNIKNETIYLLVYVDDILICAKNQEIIKDVNNKLNQYFECKDLGNVSSYLGIVINQNSNGNFLLHQEDKITKLIEEVKLEDGKLSSIPMDPEFIKINHNDNLLPNNKNYRSVIGMLLHLSITTRPDIASAVSILCRRVENPRKCDWDASKKIVRYLKATKNKRLVIKAESDMKLKLFTDANWAGDHGDRKSTSGFIFLLGFNPISWSSKKQSTVALSSTEAEFIAASFAAQELLWIKQLLEDMHIPVSTPIPMLEDNQSCIKIIESNKFSARTKHIDVKFYHIKSLQENGIIQVQYCITNDQLADFLTKALPLPKFQKLIGNIFC